MQVLFVDDVHLTQAVGLGCWVPNSSEASMPSPECNRMTRGGERDQEAAGSRIQIPPGRNVKDKLHTKKRKQKMELPRKCNQHQQPASLEASCSALCHLSLILLDKTSARICSVQLLHSPDSDPAVAPPPSGHLRDPVREHRLEGGTPVPDFLSLPPPMSLPIQISPPEAWVLFLG